MKILMVVAYFVPEIGSAAHVYFDLAKAFVKRGHEVDVITSYPRTFNLNKNDANKDFPLEDIIDGIHVHRCKHTARRDIVFLRGVEHFLLPTYYFNTYRKLHKKFDVCLMYIPPLPLYYLAKKIKSLDGTPSVLNYQDFHPQELIDVGVLKNSAMIKFMEYIERKSYGNADYITVLSKQGIDYVIQRGGKLNKIQHVYNGCSISEIDEHLVRKDFKEKEGIKDKFLISYAGILSPFQGIDAILNASKDLIGYEDIIIYIVGDGIIKNHLESRINKEKILNVKLLPLQPRDEYLNIVNSSDLSLISLDGRMRAPCLPGKLINLFTLSQPIVAAVPENSETADVINASKSGYVANPENIKDAIIELQNNRQMSREMGRNGRRFLEDNMNLDKNTLIYEEIFNRVARS